MKPRPHVVPLTADMFDAAYAALLREQNPEMPGEAWQRAFTPLGWEDSGTYGVALRAGGELLGLLGLLRSSRMVDGQVVPYCNLHTWYVRPDARGPASLALLRQALAMTDHVLTDFSATPDVAAVLRRAGFTPVPSGASFLPLLLRRGPSIGPVLDITQDPGAAERLLTPSSQRILRDHSFARHHLLPVGRSVCHVVSTECVSGPWPHIRVHHVSDPALFVAQVGAFHRALGTGSARYIAIPDIVVRGIKIPGAWRTAGRDVLIRKPDRLAAAPIDTLYSEVILFGYPLVPVVPGWIRALRRFLLRRSSQS